MANPEHLAILNQGVESWNSWRSAESGTFVDLTGADFSGAGLGIILGKLISVRPILAMPILAMLI
jgi:hypothetical protein